MKPRKHKTATPTKAWVLVTDRGRMVIGSVTMKERSLRNSGFPSDRIANVLVTEIKPRGRP